MDRTSAGWTTDAQADSGEAPAVVAVCGLAFEAALVAGPQVAVLCAPGALCLGGRLQDLLRAQARPWRGVISFGCAAGLDPALAPGTCVLAETIVTAAGAIPVDAAWLRELSACLPAAVRGTLAGVDLPLCDPAAKAALRAASGACAADMESHVVAALAQQHGLRFAACRVVLDPAWRSVPSCALAGMCADGTNALGPLLGALGARPSQLPALAALAVDACVARRTLRTVRKRLSGALAVPVA
jgi:hopanoid-associated phosphorylase